MYRESSQRGMVHQLESRRKLEGWWRVPQTKVQLAGEFGLWTRIFRSVGHTECPGSAVALEERDVDAVPGGNE